MKIYVLMKPLGIRTKTICVSKDIYKIRESICKEFNPNEDYPEFEIWEDGKKIYETAGNGVLRKIASEINGVDNMNKE